MNFLRTAYYRKAGALALIALLVCIHLIKAMHTHDISSCVFHSLDKNATAVKANFSCAICDFQVAKDSDAVVAEISIAPPVFFICSYFNYTLPQANSFAVVFDGRGPPSIA